jgi:hypothetical protein
MSVSNGVHQMFSNFLATLGALAANKKVVGSWLVALTMAVGAIGDKVYVDRTAELAVIETKLDQIQKTLDNMNHTLETNNILIRDILVEQGKVRTELEAHERNTQAAAKR